MGAERPRRGKKAAHTAAQRFGASVRSEALTAEPAKQHRARVAERRSRIVELRNDGLTYRQIAAELEITVGTVASAIHKARKNGDLPPPYCEPDGEGDEHA
jgi:DNA-binding NarL/FixJ family response regulator